MRERGEQLRDPIPLGEMRYRNPLGVLRTADLLLVEDLPPADHGLPARIVEHPRGRWLQKWVPEYDGDDDPELYDQLDAEVAALAAVWHTFRRRHPQELPKLVGYNVDVAEPFVLLELYRGEPIEKVGWLEPGQSVALQKRLVTAVQQLAAAGVLHGRISPRSVLWDDAAPQIVNFEHARTVANPDPAMNGRRAAADPARDLCDAAVLIWQVSLGRFAVPSEADLADAPYDVSYALGGMFEGDPEQRPTLDVVLTRLGLSPVEPAAEDEKLAAGCDVFDELCARKRGPGGGGRFGRFGGRPS